MPWRHKPRTFFGVNQQLPGVFNVLLEPSMVALVQQHYLLQHAALVCISFTCWGTPMHDQEQRELQRLDGMLNLSMNMSVAHDMA